MEKRAKANEAEKAYQEHKERAKETIERKIKEYHLKKWRNFGSGQ